MAMQGCISRNSTAGEGTSRSTASSRARRQELFEGSLQVEEHRYEATDSDAEFYNDGIRRARYSPINVCKFIQPCYGKSQENKVQTIFTTNECTKAMS